MDLKSFFDLEKVVFSKEELEAPYKSHAQKDVIFSRENLNEPHQSHPQKDVIFSRENLDKPYQEDLKPTQKEEKNNELRLQRRLSNI